MATHDIGELKLLSRIIFVAVILCAPSNGWAQKGKGNSGGGSTTELDYQVVLLTGIDDARSQALAISEPRVDEDASLDGSIYVCGRMAVDKEESPVKIGLWRIDGDRNVVEKVDHGEALVDCWGVNSRGMIVGSSQDRPAVLTASGHRIDLPIPPEATHGYARAITDPDASGLVRVVGEWAIEADGMPLEIGGRQWWIDLESETCIGQIDFSNFDLPNFVPFDMNQLGDMVGYQYPDRVSTSRGCIAVWMAAPNVWLREPLYGFVDVEALDEAGNIVGNWRSGATHSGNQGVVQLADGTFFNLTTLTGRLKTEAHDIATVDGVVQVVGATKDSSGLIVGYVWTNGEFVELDKLVGSGQAWIAPAYGINSRGEICGVGLFGSRRQRWEYGYLLLPVSN